MLGRPDKRVGNLEAVDTAWSFASFHGVYTESRHRVTGVCLPVSLPMEMRARFAAVAAAGPPLDPPEFEFRIQNSSS